MKATIAVSSMFLLTSCMHMGMMGTGGSHHSGSGQQAVTEPVLEKEIISGGVKAIATFPPLKMDSDVVVTLRLIDATTSRPLSGAKVYFHAQYAHKLDQNSTHDHSGDRRSGRSETEHDVNIEQPVAESRDPGVYSIPYGSTQVGEHTLMFHIAAIGDRKCEPEIIIGAKRMLAPQSHEHSSGMMGMSSTATYIIVGAVVMGIMMAAMLVR